MDESLPAVEIERDAGIKLFVGQVLEAGGGEFKVHTGVGSLSLSRPGTEGLL